jgi:DNA-directed RNA polymerase subunit RPC12/RpoP
MAMSTTGAALLAGKTAVLATMHRKERAIAPVLTQALDLHITVPAGFNTDQFGTFTRDVARAGSQLEAARQKALAAMEVTGYTVGLASEGAFGPHPAMPWVACDRELVLLIDIQHNLELVGEAISTDTNYRQARITSLAAALDFARSAQFPSHGLVAMADQTPSSTDTIIKGIVSEDQLGQAVEQLLSSHGSIWLETDMRAHMNPSRMATIQQATENLLKKIHQSCPACGWPGYDVARRIPGLPCAGCGLPTTRTQSWVYRCRRCSHEHTVPFPEGITTADPGQCSYCNP